MDTTLTTNRWARPALSSRLVHYNTPLTVPGYKRSAHRKRLVKLIRYLEEVQDISPHSFNLAAWFDAKRTYALQRARREWPRRWKAGQPLNCGTTACLVGHLPTCFPGDFRWNIRTGDVDFRFKVNGVRPELSTECGELERYFGLAAHFWADTIFNTGWFWRERDRQVEAVDMAELLREALTQADQERPAKPRTKKTTT